jgi:hypothetical protein
MDYAEQIINAQVRTQKATSAAAVQRAGHLKVRSGVATVRSGEGSIKQISRNGVYALMEVSHPDGSISRFRVPTRSMSQRIAQESKAARSRANM